MDEPPFWIWSSSGGCDACDALSGLHLEAPMRPHPNCRCTLTPYYPSDEGSPRCRYDEHLVLSFTTNGSGTQWNEATGQYDRMVLNVMYTVMCKDGSLVEGEYSHEADLEQDSFPFSNADDLETFGEMLIDTALDRLEDEAAAACPDCVP